MASVRTVLMLNSSSDDAGDATAEEEAVSDTMALRRW
jgi:hypothetical protein